MSVKKLLVFKKKKKKLLTIWLGLLILSALTYEF